MSINKHTRSEKILSFLRENQRATVKDLAESVNTTEITIRRDLKELDEKGLVTRVYGGALLRDTDPTYFSIEQKKTRNIEAKRAIGRKAAELIEDEDFIFLDAGTTSWEILPYLARKHRLKIIINSAHLAYAFRNEQNHTVIYLGGEYRPFRMDIVGDLAESMIERLRGYKAFTGADAIDIEHGLSTGDNASAGIAQKSLEHAHQVIFVGDSSKYDRVSLYKFADIDILDYIVTEKPLSERWQEAAAKYNITLLHAKDA